jgi:hypothetical protein
MSEDGLSIVAAAFDGDIFSLGQDYGAPSISNPAVIYDDASATVTWNTDAIADSWVRFGTTTAYGRAAQDTAFITDHSQALDSLLCETTYHYQIITHTQAGGEATTTDQTFTTSACVSGNWYNMTVGTDASGLSWYSITSSADGTKLAATEGTHGDIWTSTDSGATWTNQTTGTGASDQTWTSITSSSDGTKLAATTENGSTGDIWTSSD